VVEEEEGYEESQDITFGECYMQFSDGLLAVLSILDNFVMFSGCFVRPSSVVEERFGLCFSDIIVIMKSMLFDCLSLLISCFKPGSFMIQRFLGKQFFS